MLGMDQWMVAESGREEREENGVTMKLKGAIGEGHMGSWHWV